MPLVSGVCRTASAPKLSHGGSRLNASKPEANPKTRCPNTKQLSKGNFWFSFRFQRSRELLRWVAKIPIIHPKQNPKTHKKTQQIESPYKKMQALPAPKAQSISMITGCHKQKRCIFGLWKKGRTVVTCTPNAMDS